MHSFDGMVTSTIASRRYLSPGGYLFTTLTGGCPCGSLSASSFSIVSSPTMPATVKRGAPSGDVALTVDSASGTMKLRHIRVRLRDCPLHRAATRCHDEWLRPSATRMPLYTFGDVKRRRVDTVGEMEDMVRKPCSEIEIARYGRKSGGKERELSSWIRSNTFLAAPTSLELPITDLVAQAIFTLWQIHYAQCAMRRPWVLPVKLKHSEGLNARCTAARSVADSRLDFIQRPGVCGNKEPSTK